MKKLQTITFLCLMICCLTACAANDESSAAQAVVISNATEEALSPSDGSVSQTNQNSVGSSSGGTTASGDRVFSQQDLIADARQLAQIIEDTHPDPYIRGGGKVAFHLRFHNLLESIPAEGMTRDEFIRILRPFLAGIGDSHTELWSDYQINDLYPAGIPLKFGIVDETLYVAGVLRPEDQRLFGASLVAVEGVPIDELVARQKALVPLENQFHVLEEMASHSLWYKPYLQDLVPEWLATHQVAVTLRLADGREERVIFALPMEANRIYKPQTQISLHPTSGGGFYYDFLEIENLGESVAYLRVNEMHNFRENYEAMGEEGTAYPSVTETFRDLVVEMAAAQTGTLIIDLRANGGGSSLMSDILIYFLYGKNALMDIKLEMLKAGGQVYRYSNQCFTPPNNIGKTLEEINEGREIPLVIGEYDFSQYFSGDLEDFEANLASFDDLGFEDWYRATPTFFVEYDSEEYSGYFLPENVVVLVSPWTFSSGQTMMRQLWRVGAVLVGTPSAQSSNSFGCGLLWHLDNTGLQGQVSRSYVISVPEESGLGQVIPMDYQLTYDQLLDYEFDPNAELLYVFKIISDSTD